MSSFENERICSSIKFFSHHINPSDKDRDGILSIGNSNKRSMHPLGYELTDTEPAIKYNFIVSHEDDTLSINSLDNSGNSTDILTIQPTGECNFNNNTLTGLSEGVNPTDAVNFQQLQSIVAGDLGTLIFGTTCGTNDNIAKNALSFTACDTLQCGRIATNINGSQGLYLQSNNAISITNVGNTITTAIFDTANLVLNMTGNNIVDCANPINPQDVATKSYVDSSSGGGSSNFSSYFGYQNSLPWSGNTATNITQLNTLIQLFQYPMINISNNMLVNLSMRNLFSGVQTATGYLTISYLNSNNIAIEHPYNVMYRIPLSNGLALPATINLFGILIPNQGGINLNISIFLTSGSVNTLNTNNLNYYMIPMLTQY